MPATILTKRQMAFIRKNYRKISANDMDKWFRVTKGRSKYYMKKMGLIMPQRLMIKLRSQKMKKITSSNPKIDRYIKTHYLTTPLKRMAIAIRRSDTFVRTRMRQLKLKTPRGIINKFIKEARIQKGNVPVNKGKKQKDYMSKEAIEKTKATRFQPGQIPHNAIGFKDGDITIRQRHGRNEKPHKHIRLKQGVWKELQIYNWEKKNGPVPKGFVLACKDGDTLNCRPSNWYLMSMKDNMKRNSSSIRLTDGYVAFTIVGRTGMHLYDEVLNNKELIETKRLQLQLNRKIKSKKDAQQQRSDRAA